MQTSETSLEPYVGIVEIMSMFGISKQTAYRWLWAGYLPSIKIGHRRVVPLKALLEHLESRTKKGTK